jgi:hypothetical protein
MLKRQMFGRACLDLLNRCFVLVPGRVRKRAPRLQEWSEAHAGAAA